MNQQMNELTKEKCVLVGRDFVENPGHEGVSTILKGKQSTSPTPSITSRQET